MTSETPQSSLATVLILDDYPLMQLGIFAALFDSSFDVVGMADKKDIKSSIGRYGPDLVIVGTSEFEVEDPTFFIRFPRYGSRPIILFGDLQFPIHVIRRRSKRVMGLLSRRSSRDELLACLHTVVRGDLFVSPSLVRPKKQEFKKGKRAPGAITWREHQVIQFVRAGMTDKEVADRLGIAAATVASHLKAIRKKLGVRNRTQIALASVKMEEDNGIYAT